MLRDLLSDLAYRFRALFRRGVMERELDEELRFHVERETARRVGEGAPPDEGLRLARLAFGGVEGIKEMAREARGTMWIDQLAQDLRYAVRSLRKTPGFTATAILTLGLGLGASVAVFSVVNAVYFTALPFRDVDRLMMVGVRPVSPKCERDCARGINYNEVRSWAPQ